MATCSECSSRLGAGPVQCRTCYENSDGVEQIRRSQAGYRPPHVDPGTVRSLGERLRIKHAITRLRAILVQIEMTLDVDAPPGPDVGQAVAHAGCDLACSIARLEAYMRSNEDTTQQ
jgi:hypothetical protein